MVCEVMNTLQQIKFGLEKLTHDDRDYSHDVHFGTLGASQLPTQDFTIYDPLKYTIAWGDTLSKIAIQFGITVYEIMAINPIIKSVDKIKSGQIITIPAREMKILNQLDLDFCTAFATAELQKDIYGNDIDPLYQMSKIKQIRGEFTQYGANLRDAAQSVVKYGSLLLSSAPYSYGSGKPTDKTRDFLANWANWPTTLDSLASKQKDLGYFTVDGQYDAFDNIRSCLWLHRLERRGVSFGLFWHNEWTEAQNGIIPSIMPTTNYGGGHDMAIIGQKTINGTLYLVFQQSWGPTAGDNGLYYFPRTIVDQSFAIGYGAYNFSKIQKSSNLGVMNWLVTLLTSFFNPHA